MRQQIIHLDRSKSQHPGLLLQRYLAAPVPDVRPEITREEQREKLLKATIESANCQELAELYSLAYTRWEKTEHQSNQPQTVQCFETVGRLIVGLGCENVLEAGLRLHKTYGTPILPGSALKGLAAHYCDQVWGQRDLPEAEEQAMKFRSERKEDKTKKQEAQVSGDCHRFLFGTTDESGSIIFHDAWLKADSLKHDVLRMDVMTPHHPKWQIDGAVVPTDFDSPIPISFLSVAGTFRVALSWAGPDAVPTEQINAWLELAIQLLTQALKDWGIGGKTSSGYGRMVPEGELPKMPSTTSVKSTSNANTPTLKYKRGDQITVVKFTAPNGKPKFRADDGIEGHFVLDSPNIPDDQALKVFVANIVNKTYTYTMSAPKVSQPNKQNRKNKR